MENINDKLKEYKYIKARTDNLAIEKDLAVFSGDRERLEAITTELKMGLLELKRFENLFETFTNDERAVFDICYGKEGEALTSEGRALRVNMSKSALFRIRAKVIEKAKKVM